MLVTVTWTHDINFPSPARMRPRIFDRLVGQVPAQNICAALLSSLSLSLSLLCRSMQFHAAEPSPSLQILTAIEHALASEREWVGIGDGGRERGMEGRREGEREGVQSVTREWNRLRSTELLTPTQVEDKCPPIEIWIYSLGHQTGEQVVFKCFLKVILAWMGSTSASE